MLTTLFTTAKNNSINNNNNNNNNNDDDDDDDDDDDYGISLCFRSVRFCNNTKKRFGHLVWLHMKDEKV